MCVEEMVVKSRSTEEAETRSWEGTGQGPPDQLPPWGESPTDAGAQEGPLCLRQCARGAPPNVLMEPSWGRGALQTPGPRRGSQMWGARTWLRRILRDQHEMA